MTNSKKNIERKIFKNACEKLTLNKKILLNFIYVSEDADILNEKYCQLEHQKNHIKYNNKGTIVLINAFNQTICESKIYDLKFKVSSPFESIDNFKKTNLIDSNEESTKLIKKYEETLSKKIEETLDEIFRFLFICSFLSACLPKQEYENLLRNTLFPTNPFVPKDKWSFSSYLVEFMLQNNTNLQALSFEVNKKISNKFIYTVKDVLHTSQKYSFFPFKHYWEEDNLHNINKLKKCLNFFDHFAEEKSKKKYLKTKRRKSLKAFEIVLRKIVEEIEDAPFLGWSMKTGNIYATFETFPNNDQTKNLDESTFIKWEKEDRILIMSKVDYKDFTSENFLDTESKWNANWNKIKNQFNEVIPLTDVPAGHALILDKRIITCLLSLDKEGNKWITFGLLDQFIGLRIHMTGFTGAPINVKRIFFQKKDTNILDKQIKKKLNFIFKWLGKLLNWEGWALLSKFFGFN